MRKLVKKELDNIIRFPAEKVTRFGFERVRRRRGSKSRLESLGQVNLFSHPPGDVVQLPTNASPFDEALRLDEDGDASAAEVYRRAIQDGDSVADAYCNLGVMETIKRHRDPAFQHFTEALKNDPRHFESHYNLGNLYLESGELQPARLHYELAAELESAFPNVHFNLAILHAMAGDVDAAITALGVYKDLATEEEQLKADDLIASLRRSISP